MNIDISFDILRAALSEGITKASKDVIYKALCVMHPTASKDYVTQRIATINRYRKQLNHLLTVPVVEQRSKEWYEMRETMITASDFGSAMDKGKFMTRKGLYRKKCGYDADTFVASPPTSWGVKYEPAASAIYAGRNRTIVYEFGLIRDTTDRFMGASPDGINGNGVMVEIKCPYNTSRALNGQIIDQYFIQIQGQLAVCNLDECDFFECIFTEYKGSDYARFVEEDRKDGSEIGAIVTTISQSGHASYEYSAHGISQSKLLAWATSSIKNPSQEVSYWRLAEVNQKRVYRSHEYFFEVKNCVKSVWDNILTYKSNRDMYDVEIGSRKKRVTSTRAGTAASNAMAMKSSLFNIE
jgi:putative phage-type endonuclease